MWWRLNLAGLSALSRQTAHRETIKGGGVTCQHAGPWARFIHVDLRYLDFPLTRGIQGAPCLRDMQRHPKNSLCLLPDVLLALCPAVTQCHLTVFLHRQRHLRFLRNGNGRMSLRGRGVCKTKDKRGNIFKKKWRTRQLEARRPAEDQKKQGGKNQEGEDFGA